MDTLDTTEVRQLVLEAVGDTPTLTPRRRSTDRYVSFDWVGYTLVLSVGILAGVLGTLILTSH